MIGCVDGTYISIRTPVHKIKNTYVNRHHDTAVTLQAICDANKKFLDVFTGVSGKMHDSRVFKLSFISETLPLITQDVYHLLGYAAYPLSPYLMTPYRDLGQLSREQVNFNNKLSSTRVLIENAIGDLKGRYRQLIRLDFHKVQKVSKFIVYVVCYITYVLIKTTYGKSLILKTFQNHKPRLKEEMC